MAENPIKYNQNIARLGLNTDNLSDQINPGQLSYALNAQINSFDGSSISYQNEEGNIECISFPENYNVIGVKYIPSIRRTLYFLTNDITKNSEVGYSDNDECIYNILISDQNSDQKFNFSIYNPILKVEVKQTNCSVQIYWTDGFNPRRWMDLEDLPWIEQKNPDNDYQPIKIIGQLDANKLLVQSKFNIPTITPLEVSLGGNLIMGTYQFGIQYSNSQGEGYTSYYNITNPISIFEDKITPDFNLPTSKAITLEINNLDISGLYDYFNLAVIKTINNINTVELVGTFPITIKDGWKYTYTGSEPSPIQLSINDIFEKFPYYDIAEDLYQTDNVLGWDILSKKERINYQEIWSNVKLYWETWKLPYNKFEGYYNGINTSELRGYMRDEIYPFEGMFILEDGEETDSFHIPGRIANIQDREIISIINKDADFEENNKCELIEDKERWKVYNTASKLGKHVGAEDDCYVGPYEWGEFSYWESEDLYPNNKDIWGNLVNTPIRHHKFPDSLITHIHDENFSNDKTYEHSIYPIGVKINEQSLYEAIQNSSLTSDQKARIKGFKIVRGNRATNKSIVAKGLLHNVGKYKYKDEEEVYYPNYPYNDLRPDPFFASEEPAHHSGLQPGIQLNGFKKDINSAKSRYVFHSPDTHFYQPFGVDEGILKLETIEYGESYGKFIELKQSAEYKFSTRELLAAAGAVGIMFAIDLSKSKPSIRGIDGAQAFLSAKELMERLLPNNNYSSFYSSVGLYNKYFSVPNEGWKQRRIEFGKYLNDGINSIEDGHLINNTRRESSVYLNTKDPLKFPQEYSSEVKEDNSRFINSQGLKGLTLSEYYDKVQGLLSSLNPRTFNNTSPSTSYDDISEQVKDKIYPLTTGSTPIELSTIVLYAIQVAYSVNYDIFAPITPSPTGFDESSFSYIVYLLQNASSFEEIASWGNYEFVCENYTTMDIEYPEANDTNIVTVSAFEYDETTDSMLPVTINKCLAYFKYLAFLTFINASGAYNTATTEPFDGISTTEVERNISSYYGSIKRFLPSQWGRMYSYETIDTGFYSNLYDENNQPKTFNTIFGGDIFINRFSYKSKIPIYNRSLVDLPNQADINLKKAGTLGYPMFWISTQPMTENLGITSEDIQQVYSKVGGVNTAALIGTGAQALGNLTMGVGGALILTAAGAPVGIALVIGGAVISLAGSIIKLISSGKIAAQIAKTYMKLIKGIVEGLGVKNINLDNYKVSGLSEKGIIYNYVYGQPFFFVESEVNIDNRQAYNEREGNFYPNVGGFIPNEWHQEANVPILYDNTYTYNKSYSKQNKENYFSHLREDYDPNKLCNTEFPNRTIYSDKSNLEETKNNWLIYRPSAYYDFPKSYGNLVSIDNMENNRVLVRFENKSQIYNALTTININEAQAAYIGNSRMFSSAPPIDLGNSETGYAGTQHKFLLKTEFGNIFVDAKRGQVIILRATQIEDLSSEKYYNSKFLQEQLPFKILKVNKDISIDNSFLNIGLTGVYDEFYKRIIITKKDYKPLIDNIIYINNKFYYNNIEISLKDTNYFEDVSFTLSFSFLTQSWISFHSYTPDYYIPNILYFQSGDNSKLFNHNQSFDKYTNYYNVQYPYILEYSSSYKYNDEILQNVKDYTTVRKYTSKDIYFEPKEIIYFNKAWIYNEEQHSGQLNLIPNPIKNLSTKFKYPIYNIDSKDILVSKSDNFYLYNQITNSIKDETRSFFKLPSNFLYTNRELDQNVFEYSNKKKEKIRGKNLKIRHILDNKSEYKFISRFLINNTVDSYK